MRVGVPKEIKNHEYRVGLTPAGVRELKANGHSVLIQKGAGIGIGDGRHELSLKFEDKGQQLPEHAAALARQRQGEASLVCQRNLSRDEATILQFLDGPADCRLVAVGDAGNILRRHVASRSEVRQDPPLRNVETELAHVDCRESLRHGLCEDIEPERQKIIEYEVAFHD